MTFSEHFKRCQLGSRHALVAITIASLTICVATRFHAFADSSPHSVKSVERGTIDPKQQRFNKDAVSWVTPVPTSSFLQTISLQPHLAPTEPEVPEHFLTEVLYNRPPPVSSSLS